MRLPRLIILVSAAAVALLGVTSAQPMSRSGTRLLRLPAPVTVLAADGPLAVATACGEGPYWLFAWNPVRRSSVLMKRSTCDSGHGGILAQGIAGRRVAWVPYDAGNYTTSHLVTATVRRPRPTTRLTGEKVSNTDSGEGDNVGNIYGDGSLLVFNTWSVCDAYPGGGSCPEGTPPGYHIYNENVWRIVGRRKRLLLASPDEATVLSVAAGRILLQRADGSLELRGADGKLLRAFSFRPDEVRAALLDAKELVVLDHAARLTWRVYDPVSGRQKRVLPASGRAAAADVERGLLVYVVGRVVHVLRLADGRQKTFTAPVVRTRYVDPHDVLAQIEPSGLFYSYQVRREGRVRFVPFNEIRFG